jgi:Domain of unknown function (DUF4389)
MVKPTDRPPREVMAMAASETYPVRVNASLDARLSRWLWLVKWLLIIPHAVVLAFLWVAFAVLSVAAFFAILFTGRYPRRIFEFNVGVLRWTWRVQYYAIGAFGTDRYPPFTLADDPSYPARLEVAYPGQLSRGLVLVKWWLLALPHYLIVGLFTGGGWWLAWRAGNATWTGFGLIGILALIAAVVLLVTGRYPEQIFDFVLGMNRWVLRVAAYAALMTDSYPPFRLDMGGPDPGNTVLLVPQQPRQQPPPPAAGWTAGRVVSLVAGAVLALCSLGALGVGGVALWADTHRTAGYVDLATARYATPGRALASVAIPMYGGPERALIGQIRIRVTEAGTSRGLFAGITPGAAAGRYLRGVRYTTVTDFPGQGRQVSHPGSTVPPPPASTSIWAAQASGIRTAALVWAPRHGEWTVVVMNADASAGVKARVTVGASLPDLAGISAGLLAGGAVLMIIALACIIVPARRAGGSPAPARP